MPRETESFEAERQNLIADAIAETHDEIFRSAFGLDPQEGDGDTSLEKPEEVPTDTVADDEEDAEEGDEEAGDDEEDDEQEPAQEARGRGQPRGQPDAQNRDRRVAESERDAARAEARELRARLEALERAQQQPQRRQGESPQPQAPPDLFVDPEARLAYERQQWAGEVNRVITEFNHKRINGSFDDVREQVGEERFSEAFQALYDTGDRALIDGIVATNNPGRALMRWHDRQSLMSEIGDDPEAYIERRVQERLNDPQYRQQYIGGMREQAQRSGNSAYDLPPSLNSASGGMSQRTSSGNGRGGRASASDADIFRSAFED